MDVWNQKTRGKPPASYKSQKTFVIQDCTECIPRIARIKLTIITVKSPK